ncbi:RNA/RNP complex-1-interacting phosphatase [Trichoplusia ni]|uniref:RNA/RNP complex-1-interacting phosphatase n=1 Tax=Trichoplusia ni TaxID=7111 RepID=A0A7E5W0T2_TRINI|nr:RNA/RNP complex-1-interacting phosphatase [Trichoplusia ni]XP_026734142.1 RNA/RNP complex-1-interacting phosphatase [Trichoplusia ni]XP_026734143.1 RNA/RNP complex-1-interacting phosphatase [Trichoplusia ni]
MPSIPDRWIPYKACGNIIEGTRLICFKVPLNKNVQKFNKDIKTIWDIPALIEKIPKLGAVIDLTNTARYYNPEELKAAGVLHKKILMPGRIIPPENKVTEFMNTVDEFLGKDCEMVIGVHCTHGLNRTGYMVCRYMRDRLGVPAKDAIKRFEKARGYQIERENYIADIMGIAPRPPDIGRNTVIKPITGKYLPNKRSPLAEDEDEYVNQSVIRDRFNRSNTRNSRHRKDSNGSGTSFDYKYDY